MKRLFFLGMALLASYAAEAKSVVFTLTDGTLVYYKLDNAESPVMRMENGGIVVNTDYYEFSQVENFYISAKDDPNILVGVDEVQQGRATRLAGGVLTLQVADAASVRVYDAAGREVEAVVTPAGDGVAVDLQPLKQGVYVVNAGTASFKVMKK